MLPFHQDGAELNWFGLGPVSVRPDLHRKGIGSTLIREGLERLQAAGAKGCVVVGDPDYYRRFGFEHDPTLLYEGIPPEYFMALAFDGAKVAGKVTYDEGFSSS